MRDDFDKTQDLIEEEEEETEDYEKFCFLCHRPESQTGRRGRLYLRGIRGAAQ